MRDRIHPGQIGFDIDGVVADTAGAFIRLAHDEYGISGIKHSDITAFQVEDCLDLDKQTVETIFGRLLTDPMDNGLAPMPHAVQVLNELAAAAPLTFITARPQRQPIEEWLRAMLGPTASRGMRLVAMGEHDGKGEHIKNLGLSHFVDDRAETCIRLAAEGISPYVFTQPWNLGRHQLPTVDDWLAIRGLCLAA
ncbi:MAG: hypothetical protein OEV91_03595 [Desulfobulbaceae bacterium]|nr:hypothetical protein [Desulfobulbaceae bacterium]